MCDLIKHSKAEKNGSPRPLTPPANENIPYADDDATSEDLIKGVYGKWMPLPSTSVKCPPGLEYLSILDKLFVVQEPKIVEALTGYEECNKYGILNELGENVYYAAEESDCFLSCGPIRPFEMKVINSAANEVIALNRPIRCQSCFCPCLLQELEVMAPPGTTIGYVKQEWSITRTKFSIQNAEHEKILNILGPCCSCKCCCDVNFKVYSPDGKNVGKISKKHWNLSKEAFANVDVFGISFPMDLDVAMKAVMLGACILIDYMFFERAPKKKKQKEPKCEENSK